MCQQCWDADLKASAKDDEYCLGKISFGDLVRDLIEIWKKTGRTDYNVLKAAVDDRPSESFAFSAIDEEKGQQELRLAFV